MINKLMRLPDKEQNQLIFEFLIRKQEFVDFVKESLGTEFNERDLVSDGQDIFIIHLLSLNQHSYCEYVMDRYQKISQGEYEQGIVKFKAHYTDYDMNNTYDPFYEDGTLVKLENSKLQKLESVYLFCGFERFGTGKLKKNPTYVASIDNVAPGYLFHSVSKIGKVMVS